MTRLDKVNIVKLLLFSAAQTDGQHQLLLAELKRVGTQQEQLRQAVSEAAAEAASRGESFEISPLKSFKLGDSELAHLSMQLKDQLRTPAEAAVTSQAPEEESSSTCMSEAEQSTLPLAIAPAPKGKDPAPTLPRRPPWGPGKANVAEPPHPSCLAKVFGHVAWTFAQFWLPEVGLILCWGVLLGWQLLHSVLHGRLMKLKPAELAVL